MIVFKMRKDLKKYIIKIEKELKKDKIDKNLVNEHLIKIQFFQHERLIHLIVTSLFALLTVITAIGIVIINDLKLLVLLLLFIILLIPYIYHYYYLENKVQYLYKLYDDMLEKCKIDI